MKTPCFGRIDFLEDRFADRQAYSDERTTERNPTGNEPTPGGNNLSGKSSGHGKPEPVYIGIHSFHDERENKNLIHDWRAPIAGMILKPLKRTNCGQT